MEKLNGFSSDWIFHWDGIFESLPNYALVPGLQEETASADVIWQAWKWLDPEERGAIDASQLADALRKLDYPVTPRFADALLYMGKGASGVRLTYPEFAEAFGNPHPGWMAPPISLHIPLRPVESGQTPPKIISFLESFLRDLGLLERGRIPASRICQIYRGTLALEAPDRLSYQEFSTIFHCAHLGVAQSVFDLFDIRGVSELLTAHLLVGLAALSGQSLEDGLKFGFLLYGGDLGSLIPRGDVLQMLRVLDRVFGKSWEPRGPRILGSFSKDVGWVEFLREICRLLWQAPLGKNED